MTGHPHDTGGSPASRRGDAAREPQSHEDRQDRTAPQDRAAPQRHFRDQWAPDIDWRIGIRQVLHDEQSPFQRVQVFDTERLGRLLVLDGNAQCAEADEASYHELIVHPALCREGASRAPGQRALVIGGGDGGAAREILRHDKIGHVDLVDIDDAVTSAARTYLPTLWQAPTGGPLEADPRFHLHHADGVDFLSDATEGYDLIVVDASDCIGPGTTLYAKAFYELLAAKLRPQGAVTFQAGSFFYLPEVLATVHHGVSAIFARAAAYHCFTAVYPGGLWNLVMATGGDDPAVPAGDTIHALDGLRWYAEDVHRASFVLPPFTRRILSETSARSPEALARALAQLVASPASGPR